MIKQQVGPVMARLCGLKKNIDQINTIFALGPLRMARRHPHVSRGLRCLMYGRHFARHDPPALRQAVRDHGSGVQGNCATQGGIQAGSLARPSGRCASAAQGAAFDQGRSDHDVLAWLSRDAD